MNQARFDNLKLVQERQVLSGEMPVTALSRLMESVQDGAGTLAYRVEGSADQQERPLLKLQVSGTLRLQCQRCLNDLTYTVAIDSTLRVVNEEALAAEYDDDPEEPDCIAASAACDLAALVEDEVLLALPAYPRHEANACSGVTSVQAPRDGVVEPGTARAGMQAFSALQALKQKTIQSKE